tara:strand:- start:588 stop:935 length:348 start_codon:yes stop_codon:yes gene_type:complete
MVYNYSIGSASRSPQTSMLNPRQNNNSPIIMEVMKGIDNVIKSGGSLSGGNVNTSSQILTRKNNTNLEDIFKIYDKKQNRPNLLLASNPTLKGGNFLDDLGKVASIVAPFAPLLL